MNSFGKLFFIIVFLCSVLGVTPAQQQAGENPVQNWKMAVLRKSGSVYESIPFHRPLVMNRKDLYQLYLGFDSTGYCYVIQEDDAGKLPLVFRTAFSPGDTVTLPEGSTPEGPAGDFKAAELPGTSRLYVLVSSQRRQNLDRLIDQYKREPVSASLERSLLSEVFALRRTISSRGELPETQVPPVETDRPMKGQLWLFEGRDAWVITVVIRVQ